MESCPLVTIDFELKYRRLRMDPGPSAILQLLYQELPPSLHAPYVTHSLCRQVTIPAATVGRNEDGGGKRKEGKVSDE